ncbi:hypothetical protein KJ612_19060, partial [Myxococcota bacterium]|jgi:hypothetical protein|nr:hypothetical protein [Myxococcota bacterium]MBU1245309.1 hypothetical protein [Myxococcota bacterium]MBU1413329.1 hypothetical protein [Myxococcota bacterium]PKN27169.1 MAG: hypothetical protein CVU65_03470 [Deltaproteobacteria bacterium HGW-Deltaproteobacteria-22]
MFNKFIVMFSLVTLALTPALAGCGKKGDKKEGSKPLSCNIPKVKSCIEYLGDQLKLGPEKLKAKCGDDLGELVEGPCPTADAIGTCAVDVRKNTYYKGYLVPVEELEKACAANKGTFTPVK